MKWTPLIVLSLLYITSCEHLELGDNDFGVSATVSRKKGNQYEVEFIIESYLENTEKYDLVISLMNEQDTEELETTTLSKDEGGPSWPEWKPKYRSHEIEPQQHVVFSVIVYQNSHSFESGLKGFEIPFQTGAVEIIDYENDEFFTTTTTAPTTSTLRTFEITRKPQTSAPPHDESTENDDRWRKPHRKRPPPKGKHDGGVNITLIVVCTVVPIVVMVGLIVIVLIILRYRRSHNSSPQPPPPPYELTGHNTYNRGGSTLDSNTSHGKLLPPMTQTGPNVPSPPMPEPEPYTYAGELYEEIPAADDSLAKRPLPPIEKPAPVDKPTEPMRYEQSRPRHPPQLESADSVYIDPELGLPETAEDQPPQLPNYERPLPQQPNEGDGRVYLSIRREFSDAYEP